MSEKRCHFLNSGHTVNLVYNEAFHSNDFYTWNNQAENHKSLWADILNY